MRLIRAADLRPVPWKNGGGVTREVAVMPPGAGFEAFDWRLSMADITQDGPFSVLPGIDRVLILMQGTGLVLEGVSPAAMAPGDRADFPGEAPVTGRLTAGPVRDLNLMLRRGRMAATVIQTRAEGTLALTCPETLLMVREGEAQVAGLTLGPQDGLHLTAGPGSLALAGGGAVIVIGLIPLFSGAAGR